MPDPDSFELGAKHEDFAAQYGCIAATYEQHDGTVHRFNLSSSDGAEDQSA